MEFVLVYVLGVGFVVVLLTAVVGFFAFRSQERWLVEGKKVAVGVGAFRKGPTKAMPEVQTRRWLMVPVGFFNILLAAVTVFFYAPAGALGSLVFLLDNDHGAFFWAGIAVATLDALPMSFMLIVASVQLARRSRTVVPFAVGAGLWSLLHHGGLIAVSALYVLVARNTDPEEIAITTMVLAAIALPASFGTILAGLLSVRTPETIDPASGEA